MSGNPDALKGYYGELFEAAYEDQVFGDADRTSVIIDSPDPLGDEFRDADDDSGFLGQDDIGNPNENFLELKYAQPNIEVNTSGRYATHEVIGDRTIHQKVGSNPAEISMSGVCTLKEANKIDVLEAFEYVNVISPRWTGFAQVHSANTSPHSDGGSQDTEGEWLHTFDIELVEVTDV